MRRTLIAILTSTAVGCSPPVKTSESPLILLVSFDTTRADAIGAYGGEGAVTPNLDALAARGVRFDAAMTPLPTTLGSHTSMMSGLDTHGHGVPRNGVPVPESVPLVAEHLAAAGWDRIAAVGAIPLDARMGLNRGFRVYEDMGAAAKLGRTRRPGEKVNADILDALDAREGAEPVFVFAHYYDPHAPWVSAPQEVRDRFLSPKFRAEINGRERGHYLRMRNRRGHAIPERTVRAMRNLYLAQVHWTDKIFGELVSGLEARGLMDNALVIMTADHGEMLDEAHLGQVYTHGPDVDLPVTRVPMIIAGTGQFATPKGQVVSRRVRLQDIANTVMVQAGLAPTLGNGEDLATVWSGTAGAPPPHFAEATRTGIDPKEGKAAEGEWHNAHYERMVIDEDAMLVWTPWKGTDPQLYGLDMSQPPMEDGDKSARLKARLDLWDKAAVYSEVGEMDPEIEAGLRALGYFD